MSDVTFYKSDALAWLKKQPSNHYSGLLSDPPAGIGFMCGKDGWDSDKGGRKQWVKWLARIMREAKRTMIPGAWGLVWALPRTAHWTTTALEDAGFEVRDVVVHLFGTGYPKSLDVSKAIDSAAGATREVVGLRPMRFADSPSGYGSVSAKGGVRDGGIWNPPTGDVEAGREVSAPTTPEAARWSGYGTALRPAAEHWILIRKPLAGTVAANAVAHGCAGLNIDACRLPRDYAERSESWKRSGHSAKPAAEKIAAPPGVGITLHANGGWPANVAMDEIAAGLLDEQSGNRAVSGSASAGNLSSDSAGNGRLSMGAMAGKSRVLPSDSGGASRFIYVAKPSKWERDLGCERLPLHSVEEAVEREEGSAGIKSPRAGAGRSGDGVRNPHKTLKSVTLTRWLATMILPPPRADGAPRRLCNPFSGSGSEAIGGLLAGWDEIDSCEIDDEGKGFIDIARARIARWQQVPRDMSVEDVRATAEAVDPRQASLFDLTGTR